VPRRPADIAEALLKRGRQRRRAKDRYGITPLYLASQNGSTD
jgi:hypothetical protein